MSEPIRLFIGTSARGEDKEAELVYQYTLEKNTDRDLDIVWMRQNPDSNDFWGGWRTEHWSTPFSGFRWAIPEFCGFQGRAIYTDVDMLNLVDIGELWDTPFEKGKTIMARQGDRFGGSEFCVTVFDCSRLEGKFLPLARQKGLPNAHHRQIQSFTTSSLIQPLDPLWNCFDGEKEEITNIKQIHFTKMNTQPWKPSWFRGDTWPHPRQDIVDLWHQMLLEAYEAGYYTQEPGVDYNPMNSYNIIGQ